MYNAQTNILQTQQMQMQTCTMQILHIYYVLKERRIDITNIPTSLPTGTVGWYVTTSTINGTNYNSAVYQDYDTNYDYQIIVHYGSTGTACNSNPIVDCNCISIAKYDKSGNPVADNKLPEHVLYNALETLLMVKGYEPDGQNLQICDKLEDRRVDTTTPTSLPLNTIGWYVTTVTNTTTNITNNVLVYQDFTDTTYNYQIVIGYDSTGTSCNLNPVKDCNCISIIKTDKSGNAAADNVLPQRVLYNAIETLPVIKEWKSQILRLCAKLRERQIDVTNLPTSLPSGTSGWYVTTFTTNTTDNAIVYQSSDTTYDYQIVIRYGSTGTSCNTNPIENCNCISIFKTDKLGNAAPDTVLPETIIHNAQKTLPIIKKCDSDDDDIFNKLGMKKVDTSKIPYVADINTITQDGWYRTTIAGQEVIVYVEKSDPNHDYKIEISKNEAEQGVSSCLHIDKEVTDKLGNTVVGGTIPSSVATRATITLPSAVTPTPAPTCGTGIWDGCTAGIQNKYLIGGGVAVLGLLILLRK